MNKKMVSVIIPMYNAEKYIKKCVGSIINQTYKNIEIIIVDDGSEDSSLQICNEYTENSIKVFSKKNEGPSSARNLGLEKAVGDYIMFVDADDYLSSDCIENMVNAFNKNVFIKIDFTYVKNEVEIRKNSSKGELTTNEFINEILSGSQPGCVCGGLFDKKLINNIRFDTNTYFLEDAVFLMQYLKKIKEVKFVSGSYYYLINNNSITTSDTKILKNIIKFDYSLDKIKEILNFKKEFNEKINFKKMQLIEKEIAKVNDISNLKIILNNQEFIKIIKNIRRNDKFKVLHTIMLNLCNDKKYYQLYLYIKLRKFIKNIKNMIRGW